MRPPIPHIQPLAGENTIATPVALRSIESPSLGGETADGFSDSATLRMRCQPQVTQSSCSRAPEALCGDVQPPRQQPAQPPCPTATCSSTSSSGTQVGRLKEDFRIVTVSQTRGGQVLPLAAVHGQEVPAGPRPHHRGRVRGPDDQHRGEADQASDLGHGE